MPLTIHRRACPFLDEEAASAPPKPAAASAPLLDRDQAGRRDATGVVETHRLPAVPLPRSVMEEPLSDIQRQRMELVDVFEAPHNLPVAEYAKMAGSPAGGSATRSRPATCWR